MITRNQFATETAIESTICKKYDSFYHTILDEKREQNCEKERTSKIMEKSNHDKVRSAVARGKLGINSDERWFTMHLAYLIVDTTE